MPLTETASAPDLSFVFPCLNEEQTLGTCIQQVRDSLDAAGIHYEIVIADNGSTDRSREIAESLGCRVVPVPMRGYGAALRGGIEASQAEYVMFADSDSTYLYADAAPLYRAAKQGNADMAIASRMIGRIEPGAMPPLHRWVGTPVLTTLINLLFHGKLTDCNSGFRCIRKSEFARWQIRSNGMEFASELLIKALKAGARTVEIPSGLRKGPEGRVAHLRTWRDGMRHLLFIFSEKPQLFELFGFVMVMLTTLLQVTAFCTGPVSIGGVFHIFDLHSEALLLLAGIIGAQFYLFSCMLYLQSSDRSMGITQKLIHLDEGVLFFTLQATLGACALLAGYIGVRWTLSGFVNLHLARDLLFWSHPLAISISFSVGLLGLHILKKAQK
ncbi:glycosyltransferase family 2 protein [Prosthecobacter vanneervenii]|uniref:Glycosyltransferase involved in cell wall biosynthesis n=1 Tax=Prosthecobacter vanneervenii TaxID=48466 RepID=A0A7W7Y6N7_9BACT|nr:glycosyltransferase family 2 protein [Prosthecobacter vanneervenii]MBB5030505.1 glycosyltransferase involved in cell wall biosynthesis [Prosthecobacter vanneervenii]